MSMSAKWVVELCHEVWLAPWSGDPGRTTKIENARLFDSEKGAKIALGMARKFRGFENAFVHKIRVTKI